MTHRDHGVAWRLITSGGDLYGANFCGCYLRRRGLLVGLPSSGAVVGDLGVGLHRSWPVVAGEMARAAGE